MASLNLPSINAVTSQSRRLSKSPSPVAALPADAPRRLVEAVRHGELQTVRRLLRAGADPNTTDTAGNSVAQIAMRAQGSGTNKGEVLVLLLQYGATIGGYSSDPESGSPSKSPYPKQKRGVNLPRMQQKRKKKKNRHKTKQLKHAYAKFGLGPSWEIQMEEDRRREKRRKERHRARLHAEARRKQKELEALERQKQLIKERKAARKAERRRLKEEIARKEREKREKEEAERLAREEAERKAQEEAERKAREEAERKAREEAERLAREEEERKEAERLAREEAERKAREEAERKAKEEAERKAKEEAERKAKEEAERKAKEEAERKAKEEAERKAKEEAERKAKEEAERKAKEEAERKAKEEAERKAKEEAERKAEEERKAKEEAERKAKEEAERKAKEEAERKAKEEEERKAKEEAEKAKEEGERKAKEEADRREAAAIKIQAHARRRQSVVRVNKLREERAKELMVLAQHQAATKINSALRGWRARQYVDGIRKQEEAAKHIQRVYRGMKARKEYKKLWTHKKAEEEKALQTAEKITLPVQGEGFVDPHAEAEVHNVEDHHERIRETNRALKRTHTMSRNASKRSIVEEEQEAEEEAEEEEQELMSIFTAVLANDIDNLKEIVKREGQDVDEKHPRSSQTPLMLAAKRGYNEAVTVLLEAKADRNYQIDDGSTALIMAALKQRSSCIVNMLDIDKYGAMTDEGLNAQLEEDGCSALHITAENAELECVTALLAAKANPDVLDAEGCSTLIVCVSADPEEMDDTEVDATFEIIKGLLDSSADPNLADQHGATPVAAAIQLGSTDVLQVLMDAKADPYALDHNGEFPLQQVVSEALATPQMLHILLDHVTLDGMKECELVPEDDTECQGPLDVPVFDERQRLIMLAILNHRLDLARELVKLGCSYWLHDKTGSGILDFTRAVNSKDPQEVQLPDDKALAIACEENNSESVKQLVSEYGTRSHFLDNNGMSPLMYACYTGSADAIETLLALVPEEDKQEVVDCQATGTGMFALILAAYGMAGAQSKNQAPTVRALFRAAPNLSINEQLPNGSTALFMAAQEGLDEVVQELLSRKADANICTNKGVAPLYIAAHDGSEDVVNTLINSEDIIVDPRNARGATPLYIAVQKSFDPVIEALLAKKADPNVMTEAGSTPLALAVHHCDFEVVRTLLNAKALVDDTKHSNGNTEVIMAALSGHVDILKLLIDAGASLESQNDDGVTAPQILQDVHGLNVNDACEMAEENQALAKLSMEELQKRLHKDMHGDSADSMEARAHAVFSLPASHPEFQTHIHDLFLDCDSDESGNITRDELISFFARHAPELAKRYGDNYNKFIDEEFKRLDHDHDDTVSFKEFKACFGRLHQLIRRQLKDGGSIGSYNST